jgi:DNA-binding transcriptional MerR regulator
MSLPYTVQQLAVLAGVSPRTLRYYDQIGLLPSSRTASGYRIYGQAEVDRLQEILLYRELGISLKEIKRIISAPAYDALVALQDHRAQLVKRQAQLAALLENVDKTLQARKGMILMSDREKFAGFKKQLVDENEKKYGAEIRAEYGEQVVEESNRKMFGLSQAEFQRMDQIDQEIKGGLEEAVRAGEDPGGERGQKIALLHKEWLGFTWPEYSPQAHAGLVQMYVDDERFRAYYDQNVPGCAEFLRQAVLTWLNGGFN